MKVEDVISKAIEGGWKDGEGASVPPDIQFVHQFGTMGAVFIQTNNKPIFFDLERIFLDISFWQSLGKALGWRKFICAECHEHGCWEGKLMCEKARNADAIHEWLYHWHRFIDHLADGKTAEEFFGELS